MNKISQKTKSIQQNMIFNTVGSLIYYACQWLMTIIVVRVSGYENAGILSIAMSVTAAPAIIGLFNIRSFQVSDLKEQFDDDVYINSRIITNLFSFIVCILMIIIGRYNFEKTIVIIMFMIFKITEAFADVYYGIEQKNERMDYVGISLTIRGVGALVIFSVTMKISQNLFWSILLMSVFSFIVVYFGDRKNSINWKIHKEMQYKYGWILGNKKVIQLLTLCLPLAVVAFLNNLSLNYPKIYLEKYFGSKIMGIYSSVASPTLVIQLAATTIFAPLIPILSLKFQEGDKKGFGMIIKKFSILVLGLSVICVIGSGLLAKWGLVLLFSNNILPYVYLFVPIIVVSILIAINACLFSICTLIREIKVQYVIGIVGVISSLLSSIILVKKFEMMGVVYSLAMTLIIQIIIQLLIIIRKMNKYAWESKDESES